MKLIIQIPCFNEESVILETLKDLPKKNSRCNVYRISYN